MISNFLAYNNLLEGHRNAKMRAGQTKFAVCINKNSMNFFDYDKVTFKLHIFESLNFQSQQASLFFMIVMPFYF